MREPYLDVVTTRSFLFGHRHESAATLWGIGNKQYDPMSAKSGLDLSEKVDEFMTRRITQSTSQTAEQ